jgi:hypothetical protein
MDETTEDVWPDIDVSWRALGRWAKRYVTETGPWHGLGPDYFATYWPEGVESTPTRRLRMTWPLLIALFGAIFAFLAIGTKK